MSSGITKSEANSALHRPKEVIFPAQLDKAKEPETQSVILDNCKLTTVNYETGEISLSDDCQSIVLIGANGSGKTRLSTWLEKKILAQTKDRWLIRRITAQRSLKLPQSVSPDELTIAKGKLNVTAHWSNDSSTWYDIKTLSRYKYSSETIPEIYESNDFNHLLSVLFSQDYKHLQDPENSSGSVLNQTIQLREHLIQNKKLIKDSFSLRAAPIKRETDLNNKGGADDASVSFNAEGMSDGERALLYLIGMVLTSDDGAVIVIDEPEIHLHQSLIVPLWERLEKLKPLCLFVYVTHDIDFAVSKNNALKIWLKGYEGEERWDWSVINPEEEGLPEAMYLEILGSRQPVVFVEGEKGGFDERLYQALFPNILVKPVGSCEKVIETVKALKNSSGFHHKTVYGIIDRDRKEAKAIAKLLEKGVYVTGVAEIEALLCTTEVLAAISNSLPNRKQDEDFQKVQVNIFKDLEQNLSLQCAEHTHQEILTRLQHFELDKDEKNKAGVKKCFDSLMDKINPDALYNSIKKEFEHIIQSKNYGELLKIYNNKALLDKAAKVFDRTVMTQQKLRRLGC